jgi:hypothetical protein
VYNKNFFKKNNFIGIYDFSYAPYALGDAFTWQVNVCIKAIEQGMHDVQQCLVIDPNRPSSPLQPHITALNYIEYINNLFPAFLCNPLLSSLKVFTQRDVLTLFLIGKKLNRHPMWPGLLSHAMENLDYYSHRLINKFYKKKRYIPRLKAPCGYEQTMDDFLRKYCTGRFLVSVNIRQRAHYADIGYEKYGMAAKRRDSPLLEWYRFIKAVHQEYPDVLFLVFGGYSEWEKELYGYENVIIPRTMGYHLAHELVLFHKSDLFMGTSSGFSALATFSEIPYIITNFDRAASKYVELAFGARSYPFALENQIIIWERESTELLVSLFQPMYHSINKTS